VGQTSDYEQFVNAKIQTINYHIRALQQLRSSLNIKVAETIGRAISLSRCDYCNALDPWKNIGGQFYLTTARPNNIARAILQSLRCSHSGQLFERLHWLPIRERIVLKLATITYQAVTTTGLSIISISTPHNHRADKKAAIFV